MFKYHLKNFFSYRLSPIITHITVQVIQIYLSYNNSINYFSSIMYIIFIILNFIFEINTTKFDINQNTQLETYNFNYIDDLNNYNKLTFLDKLMFIGSIIPKYIEKSRDEENKYNIKINFHYYNNNNTIYDNIITIVLFIIYFFGITPRLFVMDIKKIVIFKL